MNKVLIFSVFKVLIDTKISLQKSTKKPNISCRIFYRQSLSNTHRFPTFEYTCNLISIKIYQIEY